MSGLVDTREKILSPEAAEELLCSRPGARVVTGYFDPLLSVHARRLAELGDKLLVVVRRSPGDLLPYSARAELVASLSSVEFVLPEDCLALIPPDRRINEEDADRRRTAELVALVLRRCG
jgi:hypothetical protein